MKYINLHECNQIIAGMDLSLLGKDSRLPMYRFLNGTKQIFLELNQGRATAFKLELLPGGNLNFDAVTEKENGEEELKSILKKINEEDLTELSKEHAKLLPGKFLSEDEFFKLVKPRKFKQSFTDEKGKRAIDQVEVFFTPQEEATIYQYLVKPNAQN